MKKILLILVAAMMTLTGFAAGTGDGSSKANAIEFDWTNGNTQEAGTALWYVVRLEERLAEVDDPNIALYLTNLSSSSADVHISAVIAGEEEARNYTIAGNGSRTWSSSASMLVKMGYKEMFVKLTTTQQIHLAAKVFEGSFADEACTKAVAYDYAAHNQKAGTAWYTINLAELREANQGLKITYKATAGTSKIVSMISTDCPSTGLSGLKGSVPNGREKVHEIPAALIQSMTESVIYLKVENTKALAVTTEKVAGPAVEADFSNPTDYNIATETKEAINATAKVYRVALADLLAVKKQQPQIALNNENNAAPAYVTIQIAFNSESVNDYKTLNYIERKDTVVAGETGFIDFARNMLESLDAENCKYVYIRIVANQDIQAYARLKHMREGNACAAAQSVKWDEVIYQDVEFEAESSTVWYAIDITEPKSLKKDLTVTLTNRGDATAEVTAEVAFDCPYLDLQTITRKVDAGKSLSKKINYTTVATLGSSVVYVGVTATQPVKVEVTPSDAVKKDASEITCVLENAIPFNWEEGNRQKANTTVWYSVPADNIIGADYLPEIIITNEGNATLNIKGELSLVCPDEYENQTRSLTIAANGTYSKVISKDMVKNLQAGQTLYIKLTGNQDFNFRLNKKVENEGASCAKAIPFNWTSGHNQDADVTLWYVIDLTEIQNTKGKKVHVILKNLTGKDATIDAMLAPECPCTSPQQQAVQLKGAQVREKDIARSTFLSFGEKVYIRLQGTQKFHFEARIDDADPFTPITACDPATEVEVGKLYDKTGDAAWYKVATAQLVNADLAPQVMAINGATAQPIKASIAYECPVTEEMMTTTRTLAAKQTITKIIEQSMVNQIKKYEYVYVLVEAAQDYQFRIDMVDPNTGADCMHAIEIKDGEKKAHEAGKTLWYKLNVADLLANHADSKLIFSLTNTDGLTGGVKAAAYTDCEGNELISGTASIGANAKREKAVMVEALMGLNTQWLYLQLTAAHAQNLLMNIVDREKLDPAITACEDAIRFAVNTDYNQAANDTVWYAVNFKEIRELTSGDATLIVTELSGEENTLKAELAWVCPVEYEMSSKSMLLKGNDVYTRIFNRDMLNTAEGKDIAYIRVISEKAMKFRVDMHLNKGDECANPIEFDWANGNTNPQGACLWYNVAMVDENGNARVPADKDLKLTIINLSDQKVSASADIRFECKERSLGDGQYTFEANETKEKIIDGKLIDQVKPTSLVVNFCTPKSSMFIKAEVIDNVTDSTCFEDVKLVLCDGSEYEDVVTTTVIKRTIDSKNPESLAWNDTVSVRMGTILVDSIYRFTVTPMIAAEHLDYTTVPEESQIKANNGEKLDYTAFEAYLVKYYSDLAAAYDSIAAYDTIVWEAFNTNPEVNDFEKIEDVAVAQNVLDYATTKNIILAYTVITECGSEIYDTIQVNVVKGCDDVFDLTTLTDLYWPIAFCGTTYDVDAVKTQIQAALDAAGSTDVVTIHYNGDAEYNNEKMVSGDNVTFYAKVTSTCDASTSVTAPKTMTVISADGKDNQVTTLPLVDPFAGDKIDNKILLIDVNAINAGNYGLTLPQYYDTENLVKWYRMVGTEADPTKDELVQEGGYYLTTDNEKLESGAYYAVIEVVNAAAGECDGEWRTIVYAVSKPATVSKRMINGKLYIVTEDNVIYDAQGQKVQ